MDYLNRIYYLLLLILLQSIFISNQQLNEQYIVDRFRLDQIDTVFLSSISAVTPYIPQILPDVDSNLKNSNRISNIQNLVFYKNYLFIGAENWLLKINSKTFKIEQSIRYGPLYDSPSCRYSPIAECLNDNSKNLLNNYNKLLIVYEQKNLLLSCWTARQGICDLRDLDDLTKIVLNSSIAAVANDPVNSTIGFIASSPNSQDLLYIASTYNNNGPYRADIPALSGRSLQTNSNSKFMQILTYSQGLKSSKASIEFMSRFMKSFIVKYIEAFNLGIYNYFLTVQHSDTDALLKGDLLTSKISRLCLNDLSFTKSYTEIPLKCLGSRSQNSLRPIEYNELLSAKTIDINSETYLIGLFQKTNRNNFNSSLNTDSSKQALCIFSMKEIQLKFKENIRKCYNSEVMRGLNFIKPDQKCSSKRLRFNENENFINDDFCSSADNGLYPIGGQIPVQSNALIEFIDHFYDSIQLMKSDLTNTLALLSNRLNTVNLYSFDNIDKIRVYRSILLNSQNNENFLPISQNMNFDTEGHLYLINKNDIVKLKMSNCEAYLTCGECLRVSMSTEPYCGWCSTTNQCSRKSECSIDDSKWLNGLNMNLNLTNSLNLESLCVDIEKIEPAFTYKNSADWIEINFRKELNLKKNSTYQCVFTSDIELETDAILTSNNKLKCPMPHLSKLENFFDHSENLDMVLSDDGIFKIPSSTNKDKDRINLGIYIQNSELGSVKYGKMSNSATLYNISVIGCDVHASCVSCTMSEKCSWCGNKCEKLNSQCLSDSNKCASFDPGTNKLLIPYTAHRQQAPLTFQLINQQSTDNLQCIITLYNGKKLQNNITIPFQNINQTHSSCILANIFMDLEKYLGEDLGQVQTNLRVYDFKNNFYIDSISNGKLSLLFYKCEYKANDCSSCLSINRQLSCMWCSNAHFGSSSSSCRFMNAHSKLAVLSQCIAPASSFFLNSSKLLNQCDKPQITSVTPLKIPISGGTILNINGINLGSNFEDLLSVNLQCGSSLTECDLIQSKYISSKSIWCKVRQFSSSSNRQCKINVKLKTNLIISGSSTSELGSSGLMSLLVTGSQVVELVDPLINEIDPSHIIQSANFVWLTLKGVDLDAGRTREILIMDNLNDFKQRIVKCDIKNVTSTSIRCRLNDKFHSLGKKNLRLLIDEYTSINYSQLKVNSDPLVKVIDNSITFYSGGTQFRLSGFNFDSVQSAYTFINYRDLWYSEPVSAKERISNEEIIFEFPPLSDAFFALTKPEDGSRFQLQIGFLMDGFNVTLKDQLINYNPNLKSDKIKIIHLDLLKTKEFYSLSIGLHLDESIYSIREIITENIQIYIGCSQCFNIQWLNDTNFICNLPFFTNEIKPIKTTCEAKVFNILLNKLNTQNSLNMINAFVGNTEISFEENLTNNENLNLYTQSYQLNNIDNFMLVVKSLYQQTINPNVLDSLVKKYENYVQESQAQVNSTSFLNNKNLFIISSIIASVVIILILVTLSVSSYFMKIKQKNNKNLIYKLGSKKCKLEFDLIQQQIDQLELSIRPKCSQLYQQLHNDYLNDLNNDLIYSLNGLPLWNFKTFLFNYIFPTNQNSDINAPVYTSNLIMSSSSMSNSTTNTLLSTTNTPIQKQNMSVYATIKSSSMLRFDTLDHDNSNKQQFLSYGNIGEAMHLFDQLIHNKNFLLTFITVCENQKDSFNPKERNNFSSLLILALKDNLQFLYSIIKTLLSEHIKNNLAAKKALFRGNESLIEPLINNFIAMFMYDYQRDSQSALHLYRLVKSIKSFLNMGPCDQIKNSALNSLNEDTLLNDKLIVGYQLIYVNVVLNPNILSSPNNKNLYIVPLIDSDTIQQSKNKIIDFVFKKSNMNQFNLIQVPNCGDIDLELCLILIPNTDSTQQQTTLITLKETEDELINTDSLNSNQFKRLLTLKEYNIQNGSFINLNFKNSLIQQSQKDNHVYMSTMSMNNEYVLYASNTIKPGPLPLGPPPVAPNRYHLIKPSSDNYLTNTSNSSSLDIKKKKKKKYEKLLTVKSQDSSVTTDSLIKKSENPVNQLTRLLMNKGTIQPFIDQFIESIFSNSSNIPPVLQNLFEFIDSEIKKSSNLKNEEANKLGKMCKVNIYFIRYWVNLIKNPNLILDVEKSSLIDSSLNCIAQAFIDSCTSGDVHNLYDTNSPINRLLFIREVPKYKEMIDSFFNDLKSYPTTSEHELHFYLNEFSKCKTFEQQNQILGATLGNSQVSQTNQTELNQVQVLLQLYDYYEKYQHQINTALGQQQCSVLLPVHHRLVQIKDLMSMSTMTTNNPTTLNRSAGFFSNNPYQQINNYQQPINCYAATSDLIVTYPTMNTTTAPLNTLPHLQTLHHQQQQQQQRTNQFQPIQQQQFF
ncbi:unnamed protein product [Brachionus calyciflorus]|uniref:Sema domain-containing protein n=1 Tax=Brachionus calyciflorus TaxID=104777 RepID=A0A813QBQ9_9BILA|nr:unnamed protein product [Brachionus calyciflorus]